MPRSRRPPDPALVPIRVTSSFPTWARPDGPRECWSAETQDGIWAFERVEEPGTPWHIYHLPSRKDGSWRFAVCVEPSLRKCRLTVGRGDAAQMLERRKAEAAKEAAAGGNTATIGA